MAEPIAGSQVLVLGAGLGGLSAAKRLTAAGLSTLVLEARNRPGGRVEEVHLSDGRIAQGGGEVVAPEHTAYIELARDLGLELVPAYSGLSGAFTWDLSDGLQVYGDYPWPSDDDRASYDHVESELDVVAARMDHEHPLDLDSAGALDSISIGTWARKLGATAAAMRRLEIHFAAINLGRTDRGSVLAEARRRAALKGDFTLALADGAGRMGVALADHLGDSILFNCPVTAITVDQKEVRVLIADGREYRARSVVCAIPAGPLRGIQVTGLSPARVAALARQRHASMAKMVAAFDSDFWTATGASGMAASEGTIATIAPSGDRVLMGMVVPESMGHQLGAPSSVRADEMVGLVNRLWPSAKSIYPTDFLRRDWAVDPYTLGGVACYAPGDITAMGALHGAHEPPFFVAGSDHWSCGYLEGAVRTGNSAADAVLAHLA